MIRTYRAKPELVEAVQYDGSNLDELRLLTANALFIDSYAQSKGVGYIHVEPIIELNSVNGKVKIKKGDFIIKRNEGFSIYKPREFRRIFESV